MRGNFFDTLPRNMEASLVGTYDRTASPLAQSSSPPTEAEPAY